MLKMLMAVFIFTKPRNYTPAKVFDNNLRVGGTINATLIPVLKPLDHGSKETYFLMNPSGLYGRTDLNGIKNWIDLTLYRCNIYITQLLDWLDRERRVL